MSPDPHVETDRPTGLCRLQTPHTGRKGRQGRQSAAHLAGEAKQGTKPQRHFYQHQKETTGLSPKASETAFPHWIRLALYTTNCCRVPGALLCPVVHPAPRLSPGPKYLMSTSFMLGTVLSTVKSKIMKAPFPLSISLQSNRNQINAMQSQDARKFEAQRGIQGEHETRHIEMLMGCFRGGTLAIGRIILVLRRASWQAVERFGNFWL